MLRREAPWQFMMLCLLLMLAACAEPRLPSLPDGAAERASVLGIANARFWVDRSADGLRLEAREALRRELAITPAGPHGQLPPVDFLSISGGGDNGAFGAGLLIGWTASGQRPEFRLVTGVSTGALTAPFAFLGPAYDAQLRAVYTEVTDRSIFRRRGLMAALTSDALADNAPLFGLISDYVNEEMLAVIAREYRKGRLLLIGTTNIDLQRPVLWNMGAIAASGHPGAVELFRKILLASAAIPGAFPPTLIEVEYEGRRYHEMHVDGGAVAQAFLYPPALRLAETLEREGVMRARNGYVIRNSRLDPEWMTTERQFFSIAARAISTMIHTSGLNDIFRIYATSVRDGVNFHLAYIPPEFHADKAGEFDQTYMRALFDFAYERAKTGYPWASAPPGLGAPEAPPRNLPLRRSHGS